MKASQDLGRAVAGASWILLLFGALYLVSAVAPDSGMFWDSVQQSTNAWIGISLLVAAVPPGLVALALDRPYRHGVRAPGESTTGIRHPAALALALAAAVLLAAVVTALVMSAG